jgi:hypothetical protein
MSTSAPRSWWPADPQSAVSLALSLRDSGTLLRLFEFCVIAAAAQEWDIFAAIFAALCDVGVRSIRNMAETATFDSSWSILYGQTAMPPDLLPLFMEILKVARKFQPAGGEHASRAQRLAILQQAMASRDLRGLVLPADLKAALLA